MFAYAGASQDYWDHLYAIGHFFMHIYERMCIIAILSIIMFSRYDK